MEPEAGLAWYDADTPKLELVIGVQSPQQAAASVATLVSKNAADKAVDKIVAHCADVGGAFGGKDHTIYQLYVALSGLFSPGHPVRGALRSGEVLDRLASKPVWAERAAERTRRAAATPNKAYGVGLACVSTAFGSGSDPAFALVEITPAGRITVGRRSAPGFRPRSRYAWPTASASRPTR